MQFQKKIILTIATLIGVLYNSFSQFHIYSFDLKGPIKSMKVCEYRLNDDGSINYERDSYTDQYYFFAKSGYVSSSYEESNRSWEKKKSSKVFFKNDTILLKEEDYVNDAISTVTEYKYRDNGLKDTAFTINYSNGEQHKRYTIYKYDNQNRVIGFEFYTNGNLSGNSESIYDQKGNMTANWSYKDGKITWGSEMIYDDRGNKIRHVSYGADKKKTGSSDFFYNEKSQRIKYISYKANDSADYEVIYKYHPNGEVAEELRKDFGGKVEDDGSLHSMFYQLGDGIEPPSYTNDYYDDKGNHIKSETNNVGPIQIEEWVHTYDQYGSWIVRKWYKSGRPWIVQVRTLDYYE